MKASGGKAFFLCIFAGISIGLVLKLFVIDIVSVQGISMEPAVRDKETVVVCKAAYGLSDPFGSGTLFRWKNARPGDIVIYTYKNSLVIKRCTAAQGDSLEFSSDTGYTVSVRGKTYPLTEIQYNLIKGSPAVPDGMILAIGDNYENSIDSRTYGFIAQKDILGKVIFK